MTRVTGALLVAAFVVFLIGAGFWLPREFERPLEERLVAAHRRARRWMWIHAWMVAGTIVGMLASRSLARLLEDHGAGGSATAAALVFVAGSALWLVALGIHLTSTLPAAGSVARDGDVPASYAPRHRLAAALHVAFMLAAYTTWCLLGVAILQAVVLPQWVGWFGLAAGTVCAIGFIATRGGPFSPPIIAQAYGLLVGIVLLVGWTDTHGPG
ncbi:MAG: hypothetical protein LC722_05110 [Actinobacteria bacterium]|nr:hypothetical protein [Actinomycetota bacterium]